MALTNNLITSNLVAHYPMIIKNGKVIDISGNNFHGTPSNVVSTKANFGECLSFNGVNSYVDCGSSDFLGTGPLTIGAMIYPRTLGGGGFGRIIENFKTRFFVYTNNCLASTSDGTNTIFSSNNSIFMNQWHYVLLTRTSSGITNFYINGILSGTANQSAGSPSMGTTNIIIGNNSVALNRGFDGLIDSVKIWNRVLTASEIKKEFNQYAKQINMRECLCYDNASTISGTSPKDWIKGTGSYSIVTSTNSFFKKPTKTLVCNTAGTIAIPSKQAYGTWEFAVYKGADNNRYSVCFITNKMEAPGGSANDYRIQLETDERFKLLRVGTLMCSSAISYIQNNIWYKIKITRSLVGEFTLYIKGGNFVPTVGMDGWTLVSVVDGSGSNPTTNNTDTSSVFFLLDLDAGDAIADIKLNDAIIQL